jgi:hypothetical protein
MGGTDQEGRISGCGCCIEGVEEGGSVRDKDLDEVSVKVWVLFIPHLLQSGNRIRGQHRVNIWRFRGEGRL